MRGKQAEVVSSVIAALLVWSVIVLSQPPATTIGQTLTPRVYLPFIRTSERSIPYGAMHFGDELADYSHPKAPAFNGGFVDFYNKSDLAIETLLQAAQDDGQTIIINVTDSYPCEYWDGSTFEHDYFVGDVTAKVDNVAPFYPDTVVGLMLLNEPHDPQPECQPGIPAINLYNAAKEIRAAFANAGAGDILIGFGAPADYFESGLSPAQAQDGTINFSWASWISSRGDFDVWAAPVQAAAASMSAGGSKHWIVYSVNSFQASDQEVLDMNTWACQQDDALQVWWYSWTDPDGPKTTISLSNFLAVREICDGN